MGRKKVFDITGNRYGRLVVLHREGLSNSHITWKCQCDCGRIVEVVGNNLKNGHTKSCGCYAKEKCVERATKHNMCHDRLCKEWYRMLNRASNTKWSEAHRYALRGIDVCQEWKESFETFQKWALENGYSNELSLDRIDNDKGYSPDNCRWADRKTQCRNKSNNVIIEYKGEKKTLAEWAEDLGMNYGTLHSRLKRWNWDIEKAFKKPLRKR